jgi:hypothetical protein
MISQNSEDQSGPSISDNLREYTHTSGIAALKQCKQVLTNTFLQKNFFGGYFVQIQTELPPSFGCVLVYIHPANFPWKYIWSIPTIT